MNTNIEPLRIGRIDYTNVWPVYHYFPSSSLKDKVSIIRKVPAELNQALKEGTVDVSTVSSFTYGESFEDCVLLPDLSVSADGEVKSILLFHKKPLEEIRNGRIALTRTSATSVNLLKIIFETFLGGNPHYSITDPFLEEMMQDHDAALLIGDSAIRASWEQHGYTVTDLGQEWKKRTGHGMTFAVWAVRKDAVTRYPELIQEVYQAFKNSRKMALEDPLSMIRDAKQLIGGSEEYWMGYFQNFVYEFQEEQWKGLDLYYRHAWELGLLPKQVHMEIWSHK